MKLELGGQNQKNFPFHIYCICSELHFCYQHIHLSQTISFFDHHHHLPFHFHICTIPKSVDSCSCLRSLPLTFHRRPLPVGIGQSAVGAFHQPTIIIECRNKAGSTWFAFMPPLFAIIIRRPPFSPFGRTFKGVEGLCFLFLLEPKAVIGVHSSKFKYVFWLNNDIRPFKFKDLNSIVILFRRHRAGGVFGHGVLIY